MPDRHLRRDATHIAAPATRAKSLPRARSAPALFPAPRTDGEQHNTDCNAESRIPSRHVVHGSHGKPPEADATFSRRVCLTVMTRVSMTQLFSGLLAIGEIDNQRSSGEFKQGTLGRRESGARDLNPGPHGPESGDIP